MYYRENFNCTALLIKAAVGLYAHSLTECVSIKVQRGIYNVIASAALLVQKG